MQLKNKMQNCPAFSTAIRFFTIVLVAVTQSSGVQIGDYASHATSGRSVVITGGDGEKIRITPYGDYILRIQAIRGDESFYADDRYEMVLSHDWDGELTVDTGSSLLKVSTKASDGVTATFSMKPLRCSFALKTGGATVLTEKNGISWTGNTVTESFLAASDEHFAGLGHEAYGRIPKLDRSGSSLTVSAGAEGACIVPFYLSSKGYGVFLNTTFTHTITLCKDGVYSLSIDGEGYGGQMDYFFIAGPSLTTVIDRYTQLTGRPRMPQRSIFGLHLSDKADPNNNGEPWWKDAITNHRKAGYAIDHQVNDNAWRKSNEAVSTQQNSWFEFGGKYDPPEYKKWCDANGMTVTLDLNRPGITMCWGWDNTKYGIPGATACPDFTNAEARKWIWQLFFTKALDPSLGYPGDAIWLDEFDYPDHQHSTTLSSGKKWAEEAINYHFDLLKACVKEGWDPVFGETKRPYFWSRGITAGAQRFGCYWSGDINGNYGDMKYQVKAMQSAGVSGFPYFNHDAGGHVNLTENGDNSYRQWDMGFGSFTPIWKPHGPSHNRWPLKRSTTCQATAKTMITTRYEMIPYIYTYAYRAHATGIPMARPMFLDDQENATAWQKEMQYYWGHELLVAPNCSDGNNKVSVWFPKGNWYDFWNDNTFSGNRTTEYSAATGVLPVFVREGAIIPKAPFATSTFFIPKDTLLVHVYTGADGTFELYEDDGVSEKYQTKNEFRQTGFAFSQTNLGLTVGGASGTYSGAPSSRAWRIIYHGLTGAKEMFLDTAALKSYTALTGIPEGGNGTVWDAQKKLLTVQLASRPVNTPFIVAQVPATALRDQGGRLSAGPAVRISNGTVIISAACSGEIDAALYRLDGCLVRSVKGHAAGAGERQVIALGARAISRGTYVIRVTAGSIETVQRIMVR